MNRERLHRLFSAHSDGTITPDEHAELQGVLRDDGSARQLWFVHQDVDAGLHLLTQAAEAGRVAPCGRDPWIALRSRPVLITCLLVLSGLMAPLILEPTPSPPPPEDWIGEVTGLRGAVSSGNGEWHVGQRLVTGRIEVLAGAIEVTLSNGVALVVEGPGELDLLTAMRGLLHGGRAVVRVPPNAIGFQLDTPGANVVDLGTEFAVKAGPGLITDVQVYDGAVVTTGKASGFPKRLTAGYAARFTSDPTMTPGELAYAPDRFIRRLPTDSPVEIDEAGSPLFNATRYEEIVLTRAEREIAVDGDLSEWSQAGSFRSVRDSDAGQFVEGRMRYDESFLYIAAHIGDQAPLRNTIDPAADGELGWIGGGLQVRLSTDRALGWPAEGNAPVYYRFRRLPPDATQLKRATNEKFTHLTLWRHAPSGRSCLHLARGMDFRGPEANPSGYRGAFLVDSDGMGYTLEYAIPWSLLGAEADPPRAGDTLAVSWTAHWSDESGRLWRGQLVELRNASEPVQIHTWERAATWGRAVFK